MTWNFKLRYNSFHIRHKNMWKNYVTSFTLYKLVYITARAVIICKFCCLVFSNIREVIILSCSFYWIKYFHTIRIKTALNVTCFIRLQDINHLRPYPFASSFVLLQTFLILQATCISNSSSHQVSATPLFNAVTWKDAWRKVFVVYDFFNCSFLLLRYYKVCSQQANFLSLFVMGKSHQ